MFEILLQILQLKAIHFHLVEAVVRYEQTLPILLEYRLDFLRLIDSLAWVPEKGYK